MSGEAQAQVSSSENSREILTEDAELDRRILANRQRVIAELALEEALSANAREKALS